MSNSQQMHRPRERSAFTVMELLVAMSVTAVLAGILLMMTNGVLSAWNKTSGSLSANAQAQLVFSMINEDLESAVFRSDGGVWMAADVLDNSTSIQGRGWTVSSESGNYKPDGNISQAREDERLADCRYGLGGAWFRFFTASGGGEPRAVAYQLARRKVTGNPTDTTNPAAVRYMLYRSDMGPGSTFNRGYNLDPNPAAHTPEAPGYTDPSNNLRVPPTSEIIGNNVIDFGIRLYSRSGGNLNPLFPYGVDWDNSETEYLADGTPARPFPDVVDVMVRVLTDEGARQIENLEEGRVPDEGDFDTTWWAIAEANSRVFTQRIYVNARPL